MPSVWRGFVRKEGTWVAEGGPDPSLIAALLEAFALVAQEHKGRSFFTHPYELRLVKHWIDDWLKRLASKVLPKYNPQPAAPVDVPKPNWHVRPGARLTLEDESTYTYLVLRAKPKVAAKLAWSANKIRFSHILSRKKGEFFRDEFLGWDAFRKQSVAFLDVGYTHVLFADVSGYYENIDIGRLIVDLKVAEVDSQTTDSLSHCLFHWAGPRKRGIPQTYAASHILGELYLNSIDHALDDGGFKHLRYLDDIRVFTTSELDARRALHTLTILLRDRGLNLQTAKHAILDAAAAREELDGVAPVLESISHDLAEEMREALGMTGYFSQQDIHNHLRAGSNGPTLEVLVHAWTKHVDGHIQFVDKTLLHYLLHRLADAGSDVAVGQILALLQQRPEETAECLKYLQDVRSLVPVSVFDSIATFLGTADCVFDHQKYQVVRWFYERDVKNNVLVAQCRKWIPQQSPDSIIRPWAIAYLGKHGEQHDFEALEHYYNKSHDVLDRLTIVCAFEYAPAAIKAGFFAKVQKEGPVFADTVKYLKGLSA